jgi:hypothetical protein
MHRPALFNMDRFRKFVCIELTRVGISRKPLTVRRALGEGRRDHGPMTFY